MKIVLKVIDEYSNRKETLARVFNNYLVSRLLALACIIL